MVNYSRAYRSYGRRDTPWERYAKVSGERISQVFEQELEGREEPFGRALDLGCGRGTYSPELAALGWDVTGVDAAPEAIAGAQARGDAAVRYVLGDATQLSLANPGATMLMLAFAWTRFRSMIEGVSQTEIEAAFPAWALLTVWPAPTAGLGWPMDRTSPQWYRMRLRSESA